MLVSRQRCIRSSHRLLQAFHATSFCATSHRAFSVKMSWMDSWSRPNKQSAVPPPLYLTHPDTKYCSACGRMIGARRSHKKDQEVKYCSDACRKNRLRPVDKKIDRTILAMLEGREDAGLDMHAVQGRFKKGDRRIVITMNEIEKVAFNRTADDSEDQHSKTDEEFDDEDMQKYLARAKGETRESAGEDSDSDHGVSLPKAETDGAKPQALGEDEQRRLAGQRRADEREMVRRSARRAVVFGFPQQPEPVSQPSGKNKKSAKVDLTSHATSRRHCEALMNGKLVDPSFAKGNWCIRWRED